MNSKRASDPDEKSPRSEGSGVRAATRARTTSDPELGMSRDARMLQKLAEAEALLRDMSATDDRWRLLQTALHRKDEGLLDAILSTLRAP